MLRDRGGGCYGTNALTHDQGPLQLTGDLGTVVVEVDFETFHQLLYFVHHVPMGKLDQAGIAERYRFTQVSRFRC